MFLKSLNRIGLGFRLRITFWYFVIFSATFGSLYFIADYMIENTLEQKRGELLLTRAQEYRAHFAREGLKGLQSRFEERAEYTNESFFIRVVGPVGKVLFFKFPRPEEKFELAILDEPRDWTKRQWLQAPSNDGESDWLLLSLPLSAGQVLQLGHHSRLDDDDRALLQSIFLRLFIPFLIIALIGGWLLTSQAIQPIRKLVQTIREILRTGQLDKRVAEDSVTSDLKELIKIFNRLLDQNQGLITAMNDSLDNVAHDLKTPLTRLRASAEMALQADQDPLKLRESLQDCLEESGNVVTMLNVLMDVSEAQTGAMSLDLEELRISEVASRVIDLFELSAEESGVELKLTLVSEKPIWGDRIRLQQVLTNLVDNSLKYLGEGKQIEIRIENQKRSVCLEVIDDGIGISKDEIPRIWDRLYRGDHSRSQRGLGLGLSFVKAIVEAHHAEIAVVSTPGVGTRFVIKFLSQKHSSL